MQDFLLFEFDRGLWVMSGEIRAAEVMGLFQNMINKYIFIFLNQTRSYDNADEK